MTNEEVKTLTKGERVSCRFNTSRRGEMIRPCVVIRTFKRPNCDKVYVMVDMEGNIFGNMFPVPPENVLNRL